MLFSIIIPTRNRATLLRKAIDSVLAQSYLNWELIIVDDGSTDATRDIVAHFEDQRVQYHFQGHRERSHARNRGIELAKGDYICFMDDDDYVQPHHLQAFAIAYQKGRHPETILRTGYWMAHKGQLRPSPNYDPKQAQHPVTFAAHQMCGVWSLCIPRQYLEQDRFPVEFPHWQDTHLILRLLARHPFHQLAMYSYVYVIHPRRGSTTLYQHPEAKQRIESNVAAMRHLFKNYGELVNPFLPTQTPEYLYSEKYAQHAVNAIIYHRWSLGWYCLRRAFGADLRWWQWRYYLRFFFFAPWYGIYLKWRNQ